MPFKCPAVTGGRLCGGGFTIGGKCLVSGFVTFGGLPGAER
jgi:hypothetical protein